MTIETNQEIEPGFQRSLRVAIGVLLLIEAVVLLPIASLFLVLTPLLGGLAFLTSGAGASESKMIAGFLMILFTMVGPFGAVVMLVFASVNLLQRSRRMLAVISCGLAVVFQVGFHVVAKEPFVFPFNLIMLVSVAGCLVALWMKPKVPRFA